MRFGKLLLYALSLGFLGSGCAKNIPSTDMGKFTCQPRAMYQEGSMVAKQVGEHGTAFEFFEDGERLGKMITFPSYLWEGCKKGKSVEVKATKLYEKMRKCHSKLEDKFKTPLELLE